MLGMLRVGDAPAGATGTGRPLVKGLWAVAIVASAHPVGVLAPVVLLLAVVGYEGVGTLIATRRPEIPIGWLFVAVALAFGAIAFGTSYVDADLSLGSGTPLESGLALAAFATLAFALPTFPMLFPEGRLLSRRWMPGVAAAGVAAILLLLGLLAEGQRFDRPYRTPAWLEAIPFVDGFVGAGVVAIVIAVAFGAASLVVRFRRAGRDTRQQIKWLTMLLVAMVAMVAVAPAPFLLGWAGFVVLVLVEGFGVLIGIPSATAVGVLTYQLYDVGVVVRKTVVVGVLVGAAMLLLGLLSLLFSPIAFGQTEARGSVVPRVLGTLGVAALLVAATWRPAKRLANRMVFGKRATPYEVLAEFSDRLGEAYSNDDVLPRMAKILQEGTGAEQVLVWLRFSHELRVAACSPLGPLDAVVPVPLAGDELPAFEPGVRSFAVRHRGELLGAFTLRMPVAEPLRGTGERLVTDLAAQAGLVLRNVRLTEELKRTIRELRASRERVVTAQDERARKLERDIHDGAQQLLVALSVKLGLAEQLAGRDPERARAMLAGLKGEGTDALENLRDLARGIYPPLLAEEGLEAALEAQTRRSAVPASVQASGVHRYPQEIEAAVYFCALEALQNAAKYAEATSVDLRLEHRDGHLAFEIADDGHGFDPAWARGSGLTNMRDRVEALGGVLEVISTSGSGATIRGRIPVEASA